MSTPLSILLIDDEEIVHQTIGDYLRESGHEVADSLSAADGLNMLASGGYDFVVTDVRMPGMDGLALLARLKEQHPDLSVVIITGHGNMEMAVQALRLGATDFLAKPVKLLELDAVLERLIRLRALQKENTTLHATVDHIQQDAQDGNRNLVGASPETQQVREQIQQIVEADCETVLITGETGTGKEVVAREIHRQFDSGKLPFMAVSCPTIPGTLIESELFGAVKGAFTGATEDRPGFFELADTGTLFLDEISDLSASAQAAMLRALETRRIRRVGSGKETDVDVRIVAATNTPLEDMIGDGRFRRDLLYRLNLFTIHLVPLIDRPDDVKPLANHFLDLYGQRRGITFEGFTDEAYEALLSYDYPGNIRELRNIVERAAMISKSGSITQDAIVLPESVPAPQNVASVDPGNEDERAHLVKALEAARWNRRQAAKDLGIPYSTLRYKMQQLGIK